MLFWTTDEYKCFIVEMMDKPVSFCAFKVLYWCGIRFGELLALTRSDFDLKREKLVRASLCIVQILGWVLMYQTMIQGRLV